MHAGIPPPPWTEFLTHASENITLPQLRAVINLNNLNSSLCSFRKQSVIKLGETYGKLTAAELP